MPDNQPATQPDNMSPAAASASTNPDPGDRLKELQEELKQDEDQLGKLTKERDALKADVDALAKTVGEIQKAKEGYAKTFKQLSEDKGKLDKYHDDMLKATEALLGDEKDDVIEKIDKVEDDIKKQATDVTTKKETVRTTGDAARSAQADLDEKQKNYDKYKTLEKDIGDSIKKLNDFKTRVDKLNDVPKAASMYVFLREMKIEADKTTVPTEEQFEQELTARWKLLDDAKEVARTKKLAWDLAKTELAAAEATLAALEKSRVDNLLAATDEFNQ